MHIVFLALGLIICVLLFMLIYFRMKMIFVFLAFFAVLLILRSSLFMINEGSQVVITQFGMIVGKPYQTAGLYLKVPFIWKTNYLDKRIFTETEYQPGIATKDGYFITLNTAYFWRISDPSVFISTMYHDVTSAKKMLGNVVAGAVRQSVSDADLLDTIRSTKLTPVPDTVFSAPGNNNRNQLGLSYNVGTGRAKMMSNATQAVNQYTQQYGIQVLGIVITRVQYDPSVQKMIYERMALERLREASKLRSQGQAEAQRIQGNLTKQYQAIVAPANQDALVIKGQAEANATLIKAKSFEKNKGFYNFWRTLELYQQGLAPKSQGVILSTDSNVLKLLMGGDQDIAQTQSPHQNKTNRVGSP